MSIIGQSQRLACTTTNYRDSWISFKGVAAQNFKILIKLLPTLMVARHPCWNCFSGELLKFKGGVDAISMISLTGPM
jgi:hypothetical protein